MRIVAGATGLGEARTIPAAGAQPVDSLPPIGVLLAVASAAQPIGFVVGDRAPIRQLELVDVAQAVAAVTPPAEVAMVERDTLVKLHELADVRIRRAQRLVSRPRGLRLWRRALAADVAL
jgi:hypothetical protein